MRTMASPENIPSLMSQAVTHHSAGRLAEAEALYRRILESDPDNVDARYNLGIIHQSRGHGDEAIGCFRRALEQAPDFTMAHLALSNALQDAGRREEAVACLKTLVSVAPNFPQGQFNLGFALKEAGQRQEAEAALKRGLALMLDYAEAWNILGEVQRDRADPETALSSFHRALNLKPDLPAAHMNFATLLRDTGRLVDAETAFSQGLQSNPHDAGLHNSLGLVLMLQGRMAESGAACGRALEIMPGYAAARSNLLLSMNYGAQDGDENGAAVLAAHLDYEAVHGVPAGGIAAHDNDRDPNRRLKIGYVSSDLRHHSVSCFLEPLLAAHDPASVEVTCYAEVARADEVTQRLQGLVSHWRSIVGMSDEAVAAQIREDGIDILVDLNGHTAGNRLLVFAHRPAPVQVTWLGYPNTTGLSAMDYRMVDAVTDGPQESEGAQATMSETPLLLEGCFLCYGPPQTAPEVAPPPFVENGYVTFGSFNNLSKLGDGVVAAWSKILGAVPGSRLYLKCAQLSDGEMCQRVAERFAEHGIPAERLELAGYAAELEDHLQSYGKMDIALDPFPYNGTTTTCEALWMGVPVVTLKGVRHGGRVGASLLNAAGLPELAAEDEEGYVALAATLGVDTERLKESRASLRQRMAGSPLTDGSAFAAKMEAAYRKIWTAWCEQGGKKG